MGWGLLQLVSSGEKENYINGNPQITYFKSVYLRHTNFEIECVQQVISGSKVTESTNTEGTVLISKGADLLNKIYIKCNQTTQGIKGYELVKICLYSSIKNGHISFKSGRGTMNFPPFFKKFFSIL